MDLVVSPTPAVDAADRIAFRLRDAVRRRGSASVALSGGSTAPVLIDALVAPDGAGATVPWSVVSIWQVDERVAPEGHEARNANQLAAFGALPCRVRPMPVASTHLRAAARRYERSLPEQFDVVHLGVGGDGHTASWPPDEPAVRESSRDVELVAMFNGWPRMTLTRRVVNGARCRVIVATGAAKRPVIERWLLADQALPITAVRRAGTTAFLDTPAAPSVPLH